MEKIHFSLKNLGFSTSTQAFFTNKIRKNKRTNSTPLIYKTRFDFDLLANFQPVLA